jgi:arginase
MRPISLVVAPQWQGSRAPGAPRLARGAALLADLIPAQRRIDVAIDDTPGDDQGPVRAIDVLARQAARIAAAHAAMPADGLTVTVGGDCSVDLMPIAAAAARHGERLAVVWLDAHADSNTPASSPSGSFHGMVLRALLGEGADALRPPATLRPEQVVLAAVRAVDPAEARYLREHAIRRVAVAELADPEALVRAVAATGATAVYVHFDLDALDPAHFAALGYPEPDGVTPEVAAAAIRALDARFELAGLAITEFQPTGGDDELAVLRALVAGLPL